MKLRSLLPRVGLVCALFAVSAFGVERKWKEIPLLTTEERTYWPLSRAEREEFAREGKPLPARRTSYMLTEPEGRAIRDPFPEIFRYWVWMNRHPGAEPVGIVFRPDEDFPVPDGSYLKFDVRNTRGATVPMQFVAQKLSTASRRFVLVSARVERREVEEFNARGSQVETVEKYRRELLKQGTAVVELRADTYAVIEAAEPRRPFPHDRSRAIEFERDREAWFQKRPRYEARGLVYQPTPPPDGAPPSELKVDGDQVRHLAAALAKFTRKEVFVQAAVEKEKFKAPALAGSREEIMKQLERYLDHADVRLFEIGPEELALVQE